MRKQNVYQTRYEAIEKYAGYDIGKTECISDKMQNDRKYAGYDIERQNIYRIRYEAIERISGT